MGMPPSVAPEAVGDRGSRGPPGRPGKGLLDGGQIDSWAGGRAGRGERQKGRNGGRSPPSCQAIEEERERVSRWIAGGGRESRQRPQVLGGNAGQGRNPVTAWGRAVP